MSRFLPFPERVDVGRSVVAAQPWAVSVGCAFYGRAAVAPPVLAADSLCCERIAAV